MRTHYNFQKNTLLLLLNVVFVYTASAQVGGWKPDMEKDAIQALADMIADSPRIETFKEKAYGYAIFPKVTKAGLGIGGAAGKGVVYKNHNAVGTSKLKQASFGLQAGGQQYSEVIFFQNKEAFDNFTGGKLKFDAQASAVAITEGASADLAYSGGVAVFTRVKGGLMYEASLGGQHFTYDPLQ